MTGKVIKIYDGDTFKILDIDYTIKNIKIDRYNCFWISIIGKK
ncbi:hypothetical protein [Blattabacterium punctulatus]|nr:hypothetical protein [Blattabacterium punctulatus]